MGVTLERVQFKFASIIGELCSEPDILSQFAVWVDLRLAEYKLKGSISLDCSGDTPDPVWLKGIVSALLKRQLAKQKSSVQSYLPPIPSPTHTRSPVSRAQRSVVLQSHGVIDEEVIAVNERLRGPDITSSRNHSNAPPMEVRLSPDIVIKEEPSDDGIYPISLHVHEHDSKEGRKRTAAETITSEIDLGSHSQQQHSPKLRRLDPNSADDIQTSNESLMSIIGLGDHSQDASAISVETINSDCDFILATEVAQNANEEMAQMGGNSSMQLTPQRVSGTAGASASNLSGKLIRDPSTGSLAEWTTTSGAHHNQNLNSDEARIASHQEVTLIDYHRSSPLMHRRNTCMSSHAPSNPFLDPADPFLGSPQLPKEQTIRNAKSAVGIFERWFQTNCSDDQRHIEEIPPDQLDIYLAKFFTTVKKKDGGQYYPSSLRLLRTSLEIYLKQHRYPYSITQSRLFKQSDLAYKKRKQELQETCPQPSRHL